jgi:hypothetical protein
MPRYDEFYDRSRRYDPRFQARPYRRGRHFQPLDRYQPPERYQRPYSSWENAGYADEFTDEYGEYLPMGDVDPRQERMGMRDFSEQYGRYDGGSPHSYAYSERTIYHQPRFYGPVGFSQPLGRGASERERPRSRYLRRQRRRPRPGY